MRQALLALAALLIVSISASAQFNCGTGSPVVCTVEGIDATSFQGAGMNIDPNGAVGTKQYMEWVNPVYQAFDKTTGAAIFPAPVDGSTPWRGVYPNCVGVSGNVILNFDKLASRWVIGRRQGGENGTPFYYCIAITNAADVSKSFKWYPYEFELNSVLGTNSQGHTYYPDYPKISTWSDSYYVTIDLEDPDQGFTEVGIVTCAFDRANMLNGAVMRTPQCFRYPQTPKGLFLGHSLQPADFDGTIAPQAGWPEVFLSIENPQGSGSTSNTLNLWEMKTSWTNPSATTFTGPMALTVPTYTQGCYSVSLPTNTVCVPEPSTPQTNNYIDSVGDRLMQRLSYRRFNGTKPYVSYVLSQTVQVGSTPKSQTGIQWYELRGTGQIHTGTIKPADSNYRFMPSAAQDKVANLGVGYSVSGLTTHPGISASYLNLQNHLTPTEMPLYQGTADEESSFHWGVYSSMTVDPVDDCTFWYVNEYFDTTQLSTPVWQTRISNFKLPTCK